MEQALQLHRCGIPLRECSMRAYGDPSRKDAIARHWKKRPELHTFPRPEVQVCNDTWHVAKYTGKKKKALGHDYFVWPEIQERTRCLSCVPSDPHKPKPEPVPVYACPSCHNLEPVSYPVHDPYWEFEAKRVEVAQAHYVGVGLLIEAVPASLDATDEGRNGRQVSAIDVDGTRRTPKHRPSKPICRNSFEDLFVRDFEAIVAGVEVWRNVANQERREYMTCRVVEVDSTRLLPTFKD
jgi:hypothetical protein